MSNIYELILEMIGTLESYQESSQKIPKTKREFSDVCQGAKSLLNVLGEEYVKDIELTPNSIELKEFVHSLQTLRDEAKQEVMHKEVVKLAYRTSIKHSPRILKELVEFYEINGPVLPKRFR